METINRQHEDIFVAIRDEQPDHAWEAMRAHLTGSLARLRQAVADSEAV
jgi:DNA-binding FadR family transcriptional regulator